MNNSLQKGVTFFELIIVFAILGVVAAVTLPSFSSIKENQILQNATENIISSLNKARSQTLSSLDSSEYGVHLEGSQIIIFKGTVFSSEDPNNEVIAITPPATISNVTLGGSSGSSGDVFFARLSGAPNQTGTVSVSTPSFSKTITISGTGVISKD